MQYGAPELKNIINPVERQKVLQNAFALAGKTNLKNKNVLLIDVLYRSGATLKAITDILYNIGKVNQYQLRLFQDIHDYPHKQNLMTQLASHSLKFILHHELL